MGCTDRRSQFEEQKMREHLIIPHERKMESSSNETQAPMQEQCCQKANWP